MSDLFDGVPASIISARFHNTLASVTAQVVDAFSRKAGAFPVVLSGGVFQNALLTERVLEALGSGTEVFLHSRVPPGDGGIALGQALIASALDRIRRTSALEYHLIARDGDVFPDLDEARTGRPVPDGEGRS